MPRRSLDDALGPRDEPSSPAASPEPSTPADSRWQDDEVETYKMTIVLTESERLALERLTDVVIAEVNPRRVGKGWRTKSIRMLLELVGENPAWQFQVAANVKAREERLADQDARRRGTR